MLQDNLHAVKVLPAPSATHSALPAPSVPLAPQVPPQAPTQGPSGTVPDPSQSHQDVSRMTTTPPAFSSQRVVEHHATMEQLEAHLWGIWHKEVALWQKQDDVLDHLERRSTVAIVQTCQEVQALCHRVAYLEGG